MSKLREAMQVCQRVHEGQVRKYTGDPYWRHCAEVAAIVHAVGGTEAMVIAAWLHDTLEDQPGRITVGDIKGQFGQEVAAYVLALSDLETGNRAERKKASAQRLGRSVGEVQTIKLADLISNTSSIVSYDHGFAKVYLKEKLDLLEHMRRGDRYLWEQALELARDGIRTAWKKDLDGQGKE